MKYIINHTEQEYTCSEMSYKIYMLIKFNVHKAHDYLTTQF
jgi:hypothetical protein